MRTGQSTGKGTGSKYIATAERVQGRGYSNNAHSFGGGAVWPFISMAESCDQFKWDNMQSRCAFSLVLLLACLTACSPGVPPAIQGEWQPLVDAGGTRSVLTAALGCPGPAYYEIGKSIFLHGPMRRETGRSPFSYGKETVQSVTGSNPVIISMERETKSGFVIAFSSTQPGPTYRFEADPGDADVQTIVLAF